MPHYKPMTLSLMILGDKTKEIKKKSNFQK